jgi:hypothetical protein
MEISSQFLVLVPIVIGLVEAIKVALGLNSRVAPIVSILLGIGGAFGISGFSFAVALQGIIVGLVAAGLYSSTKSVAGI